MKKPLQIRDAAYSLAELLSVVGGIAILAAIAVPNITRVTNSAQMAKNLQNAQYIVSVASAVRASGYTNAWENEDALINDLMTGISSRSMTFSISPLSDDEIAGVKEHFRVEDNQAIYEPHP